MATSEAKKPALARRGIFNSAPRGPLERQGLAGLVKATNSTAAGSNVGDQKEEAARKMGKGFGADLVI